MNYVRAVLNWQTLLAAVFLLLPTMLGFYHGEQGRLVVASPIVDDPNFSKTVLYMFDHQWYGARALVLNRPYQKRENLPFYLRKKGLPVYWGGPVDDGSIFVMDIGRDSMPIQVLAFDDLVKDVPDIVNLIEQDPQHYRVFVGYAGWGFAQFESEQQLGGWRIAPFMRDILNLSYEGDEMWHDILQFTDDKVKRTISSRQKA